MPAAGLLSPHVLAGVLVELPLADSGAEVNRLSLVLAFAGSRLLVDRHAAHRILDHVLPLSVWSSAARVQPAASASSLSQPAVSAASGPYCLAASWCLTPGT